jgi:AraC-like DNA-binding protein
LYESVSEMEYFETPTRPRLSRWIRCFWMLRGGSASDPRPPEGVFPDGCVEIVLNLADPFLHHAGGIPTAQPTAMLVGPTTRPMRIGPSGAVDVVGIRFEPHGAPVVLRTPADELTDRVLPLGDLVPLRASEWQEALHGIQDWSSRVRLLERELFAARDERRSDALVEAASRIITSSGGRVTIDRLSRHLGIRTRRLERRFRVQVGIAPKKLCRIARFQGFLGTLREGEPRLAAAAVRCGYTDQAHLTRDFRDFAGLTPAAFREGDDLLPRLFAGMPPSS